MAYALANEQKRFITRMVRTGRFNNQSEVIREALRRMADAESSYLNPPPLSGAQVNAIYNYDGEDEKESVAFGKAAFQAMRRARKGKPA